MFYCPQCQSEGVIYVYPKRECVDCGHVWRTNEPATSLAISLPTVLADKPEPHLFAKEA